MTATRKTAMPSTHPLRRGLFALGLATLAGAGWADSDDRGRAGVPPLPKYVQECGSCHLAFPSRLLPAASWLQLMSTLPRHFGTDASLDAATAREIGSWLAASAGGGKRAAYVPADNRITRADWFERKHRKVGADVWQRPAIKNPSNCGACHGGAEQGHFNEHDIRIPR